MKRIILLALVAFTLGLFVPASQASDSAPTTEAGAKHKAHKKEKKQKKHAKKKTAAPAPAPAQS